MTGIAILSPKERSRIQILHELESGKLSMNEAADLLKVSRRHIYRLWQRFKRDGEVGLIHKAKGKPSNHSHPAKIRQRVINIFRMQYPDYGPTLFCEMLLKYHNLDLNHETVRKWLQDAGLTTMQRKRKVHRRKRERRQAIGALIQYDGSIHDWFEGRAPVCSLLHAIDDASGQVFLRFAPSENTADVLKMLWKYCERFGIPQALYTDHDQVYYAPTRLTDVGRAMRELGVEMIFANSPQAKGRVERGNRTHQDRLIKALRRNGISTMDEANRYLEKTYINEHNARFALKDDLPNIHRSTEGYDLENIFCFQTTRQVHHDYTITLEKTFVQLERSNAPLPPPRHSVTVRRWLNGSLHIVWKDQELKFTILTKKARAWEHPKYIPPKDHPWRLKQVARIPPEKRKR